MNADVLRMKVFSSTGLETNEILVSIAKILRRVSFLRGKKLPLKLGMGARRTVLKMTLKGTHNLKEIPISDPKRYSHI